MGSDLVYKIRPFLVQTNEYGEPINCVGTTDWRRSGLILHWCTLQGRESRKKF